MQLAWVSRPAARSTPGQRAPKSTGLTTRAPNPPFHASRKGPRGNLQGRTHCPHIGKGCAPTRHQSRIFLPFFPHAGQPYVGHSEHAVGPTSCTDGARGSHEHSLARSKIWPLGFTWQDCSDSLAWLACSSAPRARAAKSGHTDAPMNTSVKMSIQYMNQCESPYLGVS